MAGAYPLLAEGGLGSEGVFVGQDLYSGSSFVYDPWILYSRGLPLTGEKGAAADEAAR